MISRRTRLLVTAALAIAGAYPAMGPALADPPQHNHGDGSAKPGSASSRKACKDISLSCARTATPLFAEDGMLWLIWDANGHILVSKSPDLGKNFGAPSEVYHDEKSNLDSGPDARPKLARDGKGHLIAAFATRDEKYNGKAYLSSSTDGGATFSAPRALSPSSPSQRFETIAFDPDGRLFSAWIDKANAAAARAKGETYAGAALAYAWDADKGRDATSLILRDNTCECCRIGVAFAGPGRPVILFRNIFEAGVRDHGVITFANADTPGPVNRVSVDDAVTDACPHHGPSLAIATSGTYHATWMAVGNKLKGLHYARSTDGGKTFSEPTLLGAQGKQTSRPFVLADGGTTYLAWKEFDGEKTSIMLKVSTDDGATWSDAKIIAETTAQSDHPLLLSNQGNVYLSWLTEMEGYRLIQVNTRS